MHNYLKKILEEKKRVVNALAQNQAMLSQLTPILNGEYQAEYSQQFYHALTKPGMQVIAEVKRKSPSKGDLADIQDPIALAQVYERAGAATISVLTDEFGFAGSIDDLHVVSKKVSCPVLRKDFVLDELQIAEAIYYGAKAILLIVAVLGDRIESFVHACDKMGIDALVEVHNRNELDIAISAGAHIIGVNNRNLETFEVDINNALALYEFIPRNALSVAESGIKDSATARLYRDAGFDAVLVGEALVTAQSPAMFIQEMLND